MIDSRKIKLILLLSLATLGATYGFSRAPLTVNADTITVSFDILNDDQTIEDIVLSAPGTILQPAIINRDNVRLLGWYTNRGLDDLFDFDTIVTYDVDLYAKWDYLVDEDGKAILEMSETGSEFKSGSLTLSFNLYEGLSQDITYQWQMKLEQDGDWRDISGATGTSYKPIRNGERGYRLVYRVPVYDGDDIIDRVRHETDAIWVTIYGEFPWLPIIISATFLVMFSIMFYLSYKWPLLVYIDGKFHEQYRFRAGEDLSVVPAPDEAGRRFEGWFLDSNHNDEINLKRMPHRHFKIYGKTVPDDEKDE